MIPTIPLNDNHQLPMIGMGVYQLATEAQMKTSVNAALEAGCRLFDTASMYRNEDLLGKVLASSGVPREELFLTSKVWNNAQRMGDVRGAFLRSLERLQTDYLDLYLIHWPVPGFYTETWKELEQLREEGLVRSIGVSNFSVLQLEHLAQSSDTVPAVNQVEFHPLWNRRDLKEYCNAKGIALQAYAPLARGAYADRELLENIGGNHGKTAAQTGLRWLIQQNIAIIPRSSKPRRIRENLDILDFSLSEKEMKTIDILDESFRSSNPPEDLRGLDLDRMV